MARDDPNIEMEYQSLVDQRRDQTSHGCDIRRDDSGFWNACKAWYLIFLHLITCVILVWCLEKKIDGQDFQIGSPPAIFTVPLYQAQITGLISVSLVLIRSLAGACSTLIAWRVIFVMLNREGLKLKELTWLQNYRMPILPQGNSGSRLFWSSWAMLVIILTWPSGYLSPLVTSSVTWIPGTRLSSHSFNFPTPIVDGSNIWDSLTYPSLSLKIIVSAASVAGTDSAYAFGSKEPPLRRYFSSKQEIPANSLIDITTPYLHIDLRWIDGADETRFQNVGHSDSHAYILDCSEADWRGVGSVSILRNTTWDKEGAKPKVAEIFSDEKIIAVQVNTLDIHVPLPDGSTAHKDMACPTTSLSLGKLPNVTQHVIEYYSSINGTTTQEWLGKDCFLAAEASVTAGKYQGKDCIVKPAGGNIYSATCTKQTAHDAVEADWLSRVSFEFMSEIMRNIVMLNITSSWMNNTIDDYTTGMLHLAYDAAWSSLTSDEGKRTDQAIVRTAEPVIRAQVEKSKVFTWLGLSSTLTLSALLLFSGLMYTSTKTIRDPALAALSMDLGEIAHSGQASGLCNAVALSKEDKKLSRLKFADDDDAKEFDKCRRRLVFVDRVERSL